MTRPPCEKGARCGDTAVCGHCRLVAADAAFEETLTAVVPARRGPPSAAQRPTPVVSPGTPLPPSLPRVCVHEGPVKEACKSCGAEARHVRWCLHPTADRDDCTREYVGPAVQACSRCPDRELPAPQLPAVVREPAPPRAALPPFPDRLVWVSTAQLVADSIALAGLAPADCSGVVGVPRSGMLPASTIAMHLHLPLGEIDGGGRVRWLSHGTRGGGGLLRPGGPILVVDDTVFGGGATRRAREQLAGVNAIFSAVYARPEAAGVLDLYARELREPHLLEWNYPNNGRVGGLVCEPAHYGHAAATDLDGVLVHDDLSGGPVGSLYLAPRLYPVRLIVTGRHERHRAATEADLRRVGVRFDRLVMLPDDTPLTTETAAAHKARHFADSRFGFFLESCPDQAAIIHATAKKPVICPRAGRVFQ